jgi:hypothetical protein
LPTSANALEELAAVARLEEAGSTAGLESTDKASTARLEFKDKASTTGGEIITAVSDGSTRLVDVASESPPASAVNGIAHITTIRGNTFISFIL